jgi:hypothetical protein
LRSGDGPEMNKNMQTVGKIKIPRFTRIVILNVGLVLVLFGCAGGGAERPFAKLANDRTAVRISLVSIVGLPESKISTFKQALLTAGSRRNIAITDGPGDVGSLALRGSFAVQPAASDPSLAYRWTLTDEAGNLLQSIVAHERALAVGSDMWAAVSPAVMGRAAAYTAERLSSRLAQLGYATQAGGIPPPLDAFASARPGSEKDVDFETLLGPGRANPSVISAEAAVDDNATNRMSSVRDKQALAAKANYQIKSVAVLRVKGSPGSGDAELTEALRKTLRTAGWPVISEPRADALTIGGNVELGETDGRAQRVSLVWTISAPDGKVLGTISQSNTVPAGVVDHGWGDTAIAVAEAAALGIFDVVEKLR